MRDRRRVGEPGEGPARSFRDRRVEAGKAAQVELVDDERLGATRLNPGSPAGGAPAIAFGANGPLSSPNCEHRGVKAERPVEPPGVGIGQQFGGVEAGAARRIVRVPRRGSRSARPRRSRARGRAGRRSRRGPSAREGPRGRPRRRRATRFRRWAGRAPLRGLAAQRRRRGPLEASLTRAVLARVAIERGVALRRTAPGDVRPHPVELQAPRSSPDRG